MSTGRVYAGKSAAQRSADRRAALLEAGLELYGTVGFRRTTIDAVCAEARVGMKAFYEHFSGQDELLRDVYLGCIQRLLADVDTQPSDDPDEASSPGRSTQVMAAAVRNLLRDPRQARVVTVEVIGVNDELEGLRRSVIHAFADIIEQQADIASARGTVGQRGHSVVALAVVGAIAEAVADSVLVPGDVDEDAIVEELSGLLTALAPT